MIPPFIIAAVKHKQQRDEECVPLPQYEDDDAYCIVCREPLTRLYFMLGNGPYCYRHVPRSLCTKW